MAVDKQRSVGGGGLEGSRLFGRSGARLLGALTGVMIVVAAAGCSSTETGEGVAQESIQEQAERLAASEGIPLAQAEQELQDRAAYLPWFEEWKDDPAFAGFKIERVGRNQRPVIAVVTGRELPVPFPDGFGEEYVQARFSDQEFRQVATSLSEALSEADQRITLAQYDPFTDELVVLMALSGAVGPETVPPVDTVRGLLADYLPDQRTDALGELPVVFRDLTTGQDLFQSGDQADQEPEG